MAFVSEGRESAVEKHGPELNMIADSTNVT